MSKKTLTFELDLNFILIALTSQMRDYRLCYHINKELYTNFTKANDYCLCLFAGAQPLQFSQFTYQIEASETEFYIIANHSATGCLIPELRNVNYFLLIKNHFDDEELDNMLLRLQQMDCIEFVKQIDPKVIRSHENLLF